MFPITGNGLPSNGLAQSNSSELAWVVTMALLHLFSSWVQHCAALAVGRQRPAADLRWSLVIPRSISRTNRLCLQLLCDIRSRYERCSCSLLSLFYHHKPVWVSGTWHYFSSFISIIRILKCRVMMTVMKSRMSVQQIGGRCNYVTGAAAN
jgi:hypothetical protein